MAFPRTRHALRADDFHLALTTLVFVVAILAFWTWWILNARVSTQMERVSAAELVLHAAGVRNR